MALPDLKGVERATRRRFTIWYKPCLREEDERCEPSQVGVLPRREGL